MIHALESFVAGFKSRFNRSGLFRGVRGTHGEVIRLLPLTQSKRFYGTLVDVHCVVHRIDRDRIFHIILKAVICGAVFLGIFHLCIILVIEIWKHDLSLATFDVVDFVLQ